MSIDATQANAASPPVVEANPPPRCSLAALTRALAALTRAPTQRELDALLHRLELAPDELRPHLGFKPHAYTRHRVFRNDLCELLVLCWLPGQRTSIHDHNGSYGSILVCAGELEEEIFRIDARGALEFETAYARAAGAVTGTGVPDIHRIGNAAGCEHPLVSLHIYAPPLQRINTYQLGSPEIGQCWPDDPNNPANS